MEQNTSNKQTNKNSYIESYHTTKCKSIIFTPTLYNFLINSFFLQLLLNWQISCSLKSKAFVFVLFLMSRVCGCVMTS